MRRRAYRPIGFWFIGLAAIVGVAPAAVKAEPLLLTPEPARLDGYTWAPPPDRQVWRSDLFRQAGCRTLAEAVERLVAEVRREPPVTGWVRLDTIDLSAVGDCAECQPLPVDPNWVLSESGPIELDERHFMFFDLAAPALAGAGVRPAIVVPWPQLPPARGVPPELTVWLAPPDGIEGLTPAGLAARQARWAQWRAVTERVWQLVREPLEPTWGLPGGSQLLRDQVAALTAPAVWVAAPERLTAAEPAWLSERVREVVVDGRRSPEGDRWRVDQPAVARLFDLWAGVADPPELVALSLAALTALAAWDDGGRTPELRDAALARLDTRRAARGQWEPEGPLAEAYRAWLATSQPPPRLALPPAPQVKLDGFLEPAEWAEALAIRLAADEFGQPTPRPAMVWLAADEIGLLLAVSATEPDPAEATIHDRLVLLVATDNRLRRLDLPVSKLVTRRERNLPDGFPGPARAVDGVTLEALFDGPGWTAEARLPWAALELDPTRPWRLNLATEHRRGALRSVTWWQPPGGVPWRPEGLAPVAGR